MPLYATLRLPTAARLRRYYESRSGAKVFSAGAFTLGGHANHEPIATILDNLYRRLAKP